MHLLPVKKRTLVLPYSHKEAIRQLMRCTITDYSTQKAEVDSPLKLFHGNIRENAFTLSRKVKVPSNFLPLIKGKFSDTTTGSLLFVQYQLFYSTKVILVSSCVFSLFFTLLFLLWGTNPLYWIFALLTGLINYWVTLINFNKQVNICHEVLERALFNSP
ncbi:hypothetical protein AAG747_21965 [Rapidithrix thailandica]|uniref:PRA1 family protein n=1 Tax=Rapidithrix thailandica TaxID=413964 RepID=A0AAW9SIE9_9BACT